MKIIHTADLHIDSSLIKNLNSNVIKERRRELLYNFERLINYAIENEIDIILISGDLFDKAKISLKTKDYILGLIKENPNINFFYVQGNHDDSDIFTDLDSLPDNFKIFSNKWKTYSFNECDITGINYNNITKDYLYNTLSLKKEKINIVMLHGAIDGDDKIDLKKLANKNIDYLALGHIHKYQKGEIDNRGIFIYPGCLEGRGFDEIGPKGFNLIEIKNNTLSSNFIPFAKRIIHIIDIDITSIESWNEIKKIINLKLNGISYDDMIQVVLNGYYTIDLVKQIDIFESILNDKYYFARIVDNSKLKIDIKEYENDISLKGEFIRNVMDSKLSLDEKNKIIEYGIKALLEEEI